MKKMGIRNPNPMADSFSSSTPFSRITKDITQPPRNAPEHGFHVHQLRQGHEQEEQGQGEPYAQFLGVAGADQAGHPFRVPPDPAAHDEEQHAEPGEQRQGRGRTASLFRAGGTGETWLCPAGSGNRPMWRQ